MMLGLCIFLYILQIMLLLSKECEVNSKIYFIIYFIPGTLYITVIVSVLYTIVNLIFIGTYKAFIKKWRALK